MQHYNLKQFESTKRQLAGQGLGRLPHAILLAGPEGVGKQAFAENLAALLLCESPTAELEACGQCPSCHWLNTENHPDFRRVAPAGDEEIEEGASETVKRRGSMLIRIDQIRELEDFVFVSSHRQGNRVVLLTEAEAMNPAAANALLKILEEPPATVYFILITSKQKNLLPTLRSRCRVIPVHLPEPAAAAEFLRTAGLGNQVTRYLTLAGGAPLKVEQWKIAGQLATIDAVVDSLTKPLTDPLALAARWDSLLKADGAFRLDHLVECVQRWLFDLALERMTGKLHYHCGWPRPKNVSGLDPLTLIAAWRELLPLRRSARHPLNQLLFIETLASYTLHAINSSTR